MIGVMTAANTTTATESVTPEEAQRAAARAAAAALAARLVRLAAGRWLTVEQIPVLGAAMARSIHRYEDAHRRPPTWAEGRPSQVSILSCSHRSRTSPMGGRSNRGCGGGNYGSS